MQYKKSNILSWQPYQLFFANIVFTLILLLLSGTVRAGMVDLTLFGETTDASSQNSFGLTTGDQVSLKATFDFSSITGIGTESINFTQGSGNSLNLFMGDLVFSADNFANFSLGYPTIIFLDGIFSGIDYFAISGFNGAPENLFSYDKSWASIGSITTGTNQLFSGQGSSQWVTGIWDDDTLRINDTLDIPEPGPLALSVIGILGAWAASRRRKTLK
ncbi:MAG: PEP-CTERM sorting domain-containing protein [Gammaproteobacteria bacterium]